MKVRIHGHGFFVPLPAFAGLLLQPSQKEMREAVLPLPLQSLVLLQRGLPAVQGQTYFLRVVGVATAVLTLGIVLTHCKPAWGQAAPLQAAWALTA